MRNQIQLPLVLIELLKAKGCLVDYYDPIIPFLDIFGIKTRSIKLTLKNVAKYDCVVITADHTRVNYGLIRKSSKVIYDIKNDSLSLLVNVLSKKDFGSVISTIENLDSTINYIVELRF